MAFEIEEGVVRVTADVDRSSLARAARSAGEEAGEATEEGLRRGFSKSSTANKNQTAGFLKKMFTPDADVFASLKAPFSAALSTPIGGAAIIVAGVFASAFVGAAVTAVAGLGLGGLFLGLGILALKEVKPVVKAFDNLKKTISDVGREAAKPLIKPLIEGMNDLSDLARELKGEFKDIFSGIAPVIPMLTKAFGLFSGEVLRGVRDSMPGIVAAFEGLANALPTVGKWIGDFFRTIFANSDVIDNTTESLTLLIFGPLKLLGPIISGLTVLFGAFNNLMKLSGQVLGFFSDTVLQSIGDFTGLTDSLTRIKEAWGPLGDAIQNVWDKLKAFAGEDDDKKLGQRFQDLVQSIKDAWGPLKDFLQQVWDEAWKKVKDVWNDTVKPWIENTVIPWLKTKLGQLMELAWNEAKAKAVEKIGELRQAIMDRINQLPGAIASGLASIPGKVASAFSSAASSARSGMSSLVNGAINALAPIGARVSSTMSSVRSRVVGALSGAGSWLVGAGRAIVNGLISGITDRISSLRNAASNLGAIIRNYKGPIEYDRVMLVPQGRAIVESLIDGMNDRVGALTGMVKGMTSAIPQMATPGLATPGAFRPGGSSTPSSSPGSMSPSFNVSVYVGNKEIKDVVRVEINEHDRALGGQVSSGTGGWTL